jgi:hypothetical protein
MIEPFFETFLLTVGFLTVLAVPLWIVALAKGRRDVIGFGVAAVVMAVLFGMMSVSTEASGDSCEASGGIGCADLYFGAAGGLFLLFVAWFIGSLITAISLIARGTRNNEADQGHLWCEQCLEFVLVDWHDSSHALGDPAAATGQSNILPDMPGGLQP